MLTPVNLNNETRGVTREVDDVLLDPDLPAEMRTGDPKPMTQVPPEFSLRLGWRRAHLACEPALGQCRN
jgi:hypothetical protein